MRNLLILIACAYLVTNSAQAGRSVVSSPIDLYNGYDGEVSSVALRIKIDFVNLSNVVQVVSARVKNVMVNHSVYLPSIEASALYSNWTTTTLQPKLRRRWLGSPDIAAPQIRLGANQRYRASLVLACKLNNTGDSNSVSPSTCSNAEADLIGFIPPSPVVRAEAGASMHFEIDVEQDRGAILGAFSVDYKLGTSYASVSREFNGGRPF